MQLRIPTDISKRYARVRQEHARLQQRVKDYNEQLKRIRDKLHAMNVKGDVEPETSYRLYMKDEAITKKLQKITNSEQFDAIQKRWLYLGYLKRHGRQINVLNQIITRTVDAGVLGDAAAQQLRDMLAFSVNKGNSDYKQAMRTVVKALGKRGIVKPLPRPKK
jgi:hypothetical protein